MHRNRRLEPTVVLASSRLINTTFCAKRWEIYSPLGRVFLSLSHHRKVVGERAPYFWGQGAQQVVVAVVALFRPWGNVALACL